MPGFSPQDQTQSSSKLPTVTQVGNGPPVVFLHSMAGGAASWKPQLDALSPRYQCFAWDMPGYGRSPAVAEATTLQQMSDLLNDLLTEHGIEQPVHLVGLSVGGMIAQRFTLLYPRRVASLVVLDSSASFGNGATSGAEDWAAETIKSIRAASHADYCHDMVHGIMSPATAESVKATAVAVMQRSTVPGLCLAANLIAGHDASAELAAITVPTTVIVGEQDQETPVSYAQSISEAIPGARLVVIPESGHLSNVEEPEAVTAALLDHLHGATR